MKRMITDAELLAELEQGNSSLAIAAKYGMSRQTVNARRHRLRFQATTVTVVAKPAAKRLAEAEMDAIAVVQQCMERLTMLSDAYHEWLLDPMAEATGERYFIGPRATEIEVIYTTPGDHRRRKATLQELLDRIGGQEGQEGQEGQIEAQSVERKCADPRTELRATVATISTTVGQMIELAAMLADIRAMQALRDAILEELQRVDEGVARRIVSALRSRLVFSGVGGQLRSRDRS